MDTNMTYDAYGENLIKRSGKIQKQHFVTMVLIFLYRCIFKETLNWNLRHSPFTEKLININI